MPELAKGLMIIGVVLFLVGLIWTVIGRLPGDLVIKKGSTTFYFPIGTSLVLSVALSLIFYLIGRFR